MGILKEKRHFGVWTLETPTALRSLNSGDTELGIGQLRSDFQMPPATPNSPRRAGHRGLLTNVPLDQMDSVSAVAVAPIVEKQKDAATTVQELEAKVAMLEQRLARIEDVTAMPAVPQPVTSPVAGSAMDGMVLPGALRHLTAAVHDS